MALAGIAFCAAKVYEAVMLICGYAPPLGWMP